ncbi:DUF669 domain-containing protein [Lactobacillus salivarius]|jgi:hypothetical protein|uniref:DUF669 domain-containing protein n=1 Tax=Ligilactobacillus salivarius TaxID=1624 RepID=UPI00136B65DB|nr:DUF669 domain-containing protein [Ligilactobacillus salivarius]MYU49144.1 DUF669 domain-containing protein [Ligilactobacillus salivarius]MYU95485.1 DUF669 domain-containing protein [Ligilactobacillus salivarius]MYZ22333.1 DUF669 domain-containing protein [Ligilactobacillus salivarius]UIP52226.1 DUF669 domain-containing protein [Ligilactobacillus salivarius]WGT60814.1 DUF669 domain-containing protein [Ligilactobacillus salivarius]
MSNWTKFDKEFDNEALRDEVKEAAENGGSGEYREVPTGDYEVEIEKLECTSSKKGDPMVTVWFNILEGDFEGSKIFMNQLITKGFQIHIVNEFLRSLGTDNDVEFKTFSQYEELINKIFDDLDSDGLEYRLKYGKSKKGYPTFEIKEVYDD